MGPIHSRPACRHSLHSLMPVCYGRSCSACSENENRRMGVDRTDRVLGNEDLAILVETGRELAEQISLNALLASILERASELTDSPDASVILFNPKRQSLYFAQAIGDSADYLLKRWGEFGEKSIPVNKKWKALDVFTSCQSISLDKYAA